MSCLFIPPGTAIISFHMQIACRPAIHDQEAGAYLAGFARRNFAPFRRNGRPAIAHGRLHVLLEGMEITHTRSKPGCQSQVATRRMPAGCRLMLDP